MNEYQLLDKISAAIEKASCPHRQGPYGLFDYTMYPGDAAPHVVRDYRDPRSATFGDAVFRSHHREKAEAEYRLLTQRHIAKAVLDVVREAEGLNAGAEQGIAAGDDTQPTAFS